MIFLVTGEIGSGKTERILSICRSLPSDSIRGVLSPKRYTSGEFAGYDLHDIRRGSSMPLGRLSSLYRGQFRSPFAFDRFTFDQEAFDYGCREILEGAEDGRCLNVIIDEVGPMELAGFAFAPALRGIVERRAFASKDIYIAVRSSCVGQVCSLFGIEVYSVL